MAVGAAGAGAAPAPPTDAQCRATHPHRVLAPIAAYDPKPGAPRVFAMQYKQEPRYVETYDTFRTKIECMIREYVLPRLAHGRPNVVAFNEDVGLATIATGSRGRAARDGFAQPGRQPSCEQAGVPCAAALGLGSVTAGYAPQVAAYQARFNEPNAVKATWIAVTDTFARGWMQTFSDMAKRYGVYMLGSNNQAPFKESTDPIDVATFSDPDLSPRPLSVYVATEDNVYNESFLWAPDDVTSSGPPPLRNVVARTKKLPLTSIEEEFQLTPGPATVDNVRPYNFPGTRAKMSFATSLPAFQFGHGFGSPPPSGDPCTKIAQQYMRCIDKLGANVVMQDEANPGRWATSMTGSGSWQPLEWMGSSWRTVAEPTVTFDYNVTPFMVGNLADLPFDGQTTIAQRGLTGEGCNYVGNSRFLPGDPAAYRAYAGPKSEFLALAPWVVTDSSRGELTDLGGKLAPGSNDSLENDYLETTVVADLPIPPDRNRDNCVTAAPPPLHGGCADRSAPSSRFLGRRRGARVSLRRRLTLRGRASDRGCGRVSRVLVAVYKRIGRGGRRCRFLTAKRRLGRRRSCRRPRYVRARGRSHWKLSVRRRLPRGRYAARSRAVDRAGNVERKRRARGRSRNVVRFRIR